MDAARADLDIGKEWGEKEKKMGAGCGYPHITSWKFDIAPRSRWV